MATNSLHLTTFCLQHKPTVIACVCIHLACKWSNWEIPVSTDGKHWWEYVDSSVTLQLLDELTHEFLQILEKTPSRLKRIRNWRATQAAKKPKGDGQPSDSGSLTGTMISDQAMVDAIPGMSANATFPKASASFPVTLPGSLCLDSVVGLQGGSYSLGVPGDWPQDQGQCSDPFSAKQLPPHASLHTLRPDRSVEFNPVKHEHKANSSSGKHATPSCPPAPAPPAQKMSLEKYKEKHAAELAAQKRRQEQQQGGDVADTHAGPAQAEQRRHAQPHPYGPQGTGTAPPPSTASPLKVKLPLLPQEKPQGDKRDKGSLLKLRLPVPAPGEKGAPSREELKMKIKVSSERHSSSDEGGVKSKRAGLPVNKERHRDHATPRHLHAHGPPHTHGGRPAPETPSPAAALRSPPGLGGEGPSGTSRKRIHGDSGHNHHSKKSKSSRSSAGGLRTAPHPGDTGQEAGGEWQA
ncbi:cyclin-T2a isoform X2 [Brachyhypopomus gauderio]